MTRTEGVRKDQVSYSKSSQDVMRRFQNMLQHGWPLPVVNGVIKIFLPLTSRGPTLKGLNFCREHFNDAHHKDMETLPETNSEFAPKVRPSQKENNVPTIHFQVQVVSFREAEASYKRMVSSQSTHKPNRPSLPSSKC